MRRAAAQGHRRTLAVPLGTDSAPRTRACMRFDSSQLVFVAHALSRDARHRRGPYQPRCSRTPAPGGALCPWLLSACACTAPSALCAFTAAPRAAFFCERACAPATSFAVWALRCSCLPPAMSDSSCSGSFAGDSEDESECYFYDSGGSDAEEHLANASGGVALEQAYEVVSPEVRCLPTRGARREGVAAVSTSSAITASGRLVRGGASVPCRRTWAANSQPGRCGSTLAKLASRRSVRDVLPARWRAAYDKSCAEPCMRGADQTHCVTCACGDTRVACLCSVGGLPAPVRLRAPRERSEAQACVRGAILINACRPCATPRAPPSLSEAVAHTRCISH